jgi:hypothetical protein
MSKPDEPPGTPPGKDESITDSPQRPTPEKPYPRALLGKREAITAGPAAAGGDFAPRSVSSRNQAEIARVRRKLGWFRLSYWIAFALVPGGCIGPMSLLSVFRDQSVQAGLAITGVILSMVSLGCMILLWRDSGRCRRSLTVAEQAERMGWRFTEKPPPERYYRLKQLQAFSHANNDFGVNLVEGEVAGCAAWAIDFTPDGGARSFMIAPAGTAVGTDNSVQTVLLLEGAAGGMPDFVVAPKRWTDRVGQMFGGWLITLPDYPEFNEQMALRGRDKETVADRLTPEFIALCLKEKDLTIEVQDGDLALHRRKKVLAPQRFAEVLEHAALLVEALR